MGKRICWVTASYFLDVDLPIAPKLMNYFSIDWKIITSENLKESDKNYILSQTDKPFELIISKGRFYSYSYYLFLKSLIISIKSQNYDWIYLDISDYFFLFPLVKKYLGNEKVTIATHNVSIPKGARLPYLAKLSMGYITRNFKHFQVFSKNQEKVLMGKIKNSKIFYCPLMLKDYGHKNERVESTQTRFLFFGNIIPYKRVDILLQSTNMLVEKGITNFRVDICGYCKPDVWTTNYQPLIKYPSYVNCDIRRIPNELVGHYFNKNDYFVMPYQDIAQSGAMTVALNYNMPIIASDLDTFTEFIIHKKNGYLFSQGNVEELANAMKWAIDKSPQDYLELKHNLQKMVDDNLATDIIVDKYIKYFQKCLN